MKTIADLKRGDLCIDADGNLARVKTLGSMLYYGYAGHVNDEYLHQLNIDEEDLEAAIEVSDMDEDHLGN